MDHRELTGGRDRSRAGDLKIAAGCCLGRGERPEAARLLAAAAAADPFDDDAWLLAAFLHHEQGRHGEALDAATRALALRPYHPRAANLLGAIATDAGRPQLARAAFDRARELAPGLEPVHHDRRARHARRAEAADAAGAAARAALSADLAALSAVVLVRDDSRRLAATAESLAGLAAQFVVVDPHGTTRDVDLPCGAILVREPSADDPGAWNAGLAVASCAWILLLEAGETIDRRRHADWRARLAGREHIAHPVAIHRAAEVGSAPRLLRNVPGLGLRGRAHPCPVRALAEPGRSWGLGWGEPGLALGSTLAAPDAATLLARAEHDADFDRSNATALAYRAWHLVRRGDPSPALELLRRGRGTLERAEVRLAEPELERLATVEAYCLMRLDRAAEMAAVLAAPGLPEPRPANLLFLDGAAALAAGRPEDAARALAPALSRAATVFHFDALPETLGPGLPNLLGSALLERRDLEGAEGAFREAVRRHPAGSEARLGLIGVGLMRGRPEQALAELDGLAADCGHQAQAWLAGARVLAGIRGAAELRAHWLEEAARRFPEHGAVLEQCAEACLCGGRAEQALALWEQLGSRPSLAARFTACLAAGRELPAAPESVQGELVSGMLDWYRKLWRHEAWGTLDAVLCGLDRAIARVPKLREATAGWLDGAGQAEAAARVRALR